MTATQTLGGVYEIGHIDSGSIAILTIAIAEVGLETHKLIQSFPIADELLYNGVIDEECHPLGFDFQSHDEILKQQLRLRRIKLIHGLDGELGKL